MEKESNNAPNAPLTINRARLEKAWVNKDNVKRRRDTRTPWQHTQKERSGATKNENDQKHNFNFVLFSVS